MHRSLVVNLLVMALAVVVAATVIGLVTLWPDETKLQATPGSLPTQAETEKARVVGVREAACAEGSSEICRRVAVELLSGTDRGKRTSFTVGDLGEGSNAEVGDRVRVHANPVPATAVGGVNVDPYVFADFERRRPLAILFVIFAALVIATGRFRGFRALVGLVASLAIVVFFLVPAILDGKTPETVALIGAFAVMLVTIPLAHGLGVKMLAACLGTAVSLLLTLLLAQSFTDLAHLTGLSSDEAVFLRATAGDISLQGLVLAGMLIGALGVLDDLTVSQASTVLALQRANAGQGFGALFRGATSVGHDHVAATVNTLVLAYVGASLPVLLIFSFGGTSFTDAINNEAVAEQVVAMLVGSIGLIAAVPITTALAALLATRVRILADAPAHVHAHSDV
jgi:uncharacterized membrane protein